MMDKISKATADKIRFLFETGLNVKEISEKTGIGRKAVGETACTSYGARTIEEARKKVMSDQYFRIQYLKKKAGK